VSRQQLLAFDEFEIVGFGFIEMGDGPVFLVDEAVDLSVVSSGHF
jgi:hypothetical protein